MATTPQMHHKWGEWEAVHQWPLWPSFAKQSRTSPAASSITGGGASQWAGGQGWGRGSGAAGKDSKSQKGFWSLLPPHLFLGTLL